MTLFAKMDEKMNPFGRNSMTLWKCRRVMTGKWLTMGEDEYEAPYPKMFSAVKGIKVARWQHTSKFNHLLSYGCTGLEGSNFAA